ncbi:aldehyde dehydrogenase family protein [Arthrobacter sp. ISL-72]|uniref:aldehyde dehydrogenase family protein n=1 Tax=Arthrobacter sp. ISL-72 TaxID=2819114 RepID=UPI00288C27E5|nr:aldehyde dehydrogenase family protein [Arthrobacter sp. ISL-72]
MSSARGTFRSTCPSAVAPALALGNAVVIKPASDSPVTGGLILARVFEEAGLPPGVLNVVLGAGSEIGDDFVTHAVPGLISSRIHTHWPERRQACRRREAPQALELGGNSPLVVLADANLDAAVEAAVLGKFLNQGQICMSVNRIIVEAPLYDEFLDRFTAAASGVPFGDPASAQTLVCPVVNDSQLEGLKAKIATAKAEGARTVLEGEIRGRIVPPDVFADVSPDMEIAREEIFGPLVGIIKADDEAHALELANSSEFGLSSSVFTQDLDRGVQFSLGIKAGMTHINEMPVHDESHVPFGGEGNSGLGRFNGDWAIAEFTTDHTVGVKRI